MKYAGIGSRETPQDICILMEDFAFAFGPDVILRSGGADGADLSFEFGAINGGGLKEIYLPWKGFNGCLNGHLNEPTEQAFEIAAHYHPGWDYLKAPVKKLIARNSHQVLGENLDDPVDMIICWTPDGSLDGKGKKSGGTGQALRIACDYPDIDVFNLQRADHRRWIIEAIEEDGIPLGKC